MTVKCTFFICLFAYLGTAQKTRVKLNCERAITVIEEQEIMVPFPGLKGLEKNALCPLLEKQQIPNNSVWFLFEPARKGKLSLPCSIFLDSFDLLIVKTNIQDACNEINTGSGAPVFIKPNTNCQELQNVSVDVEKGYSYYIVYFSKERDDSNISFRVNFQAINSLGEEVLDTLCLNLVYDKFKPVYSFHVLDQETKKPVSSRIVISSAAELNGTYLASDLYMNITRTIRNGSIKIDAEGYLSKDFENHYFQTDGTSTSRDSLFLQKIKKGVVAKLEKIYFHAGKNKILAESLPKLKRLRDFMILNPGVSIEIQGHVNQDGTKRASKLLSQRRANQILKYLLNEGVARHRLTAVGFGFEKPVFRDPKNEEQKEANRRVEILIK